MQNIRTKKMDLEQLQKLQDCFSESAHVFAFCVDENGRKMTELSGDKAEAKRILEQINDEQLAEMLERVMKSDVEDQVVESTNDPYVKVACISVKIDKIPVLNWIVLGVVSEKPLGPYLSTTTEKSFYYGLDLLRIGTHMICKERAEAMDAIMQSRRSIHSASEMSISLKKSEAMTEIVQLFESGEGIEKITGDILKRAGEICDISHAYIIRPNKDGQTSDLIGSYVVSNEEKLFLRDIGFETPEFIQNVERTIVISTETKISDHLRHCLEAYHIRAICMIPIMIQNKSAMTACFIESRHMKSWNIEEIKFLNDITKMIQNIVVKRIQQNSLASSYASLEAILDNVGSGIFVRDSVSGQVLFSNKILKSTFPRELEEGTLGRLFDDGVSKAGDESYLEIYYSQKERWYDLHHTKISWVDGRHVTLCAIYDITDKKKYQKKIEQQAKNDFLTGLYNRMCCEKDLQNHIKKCKQNGTEGVLMYLDLDDFKHINDGLGHQYGDVLLKAISHSLQRIEGIENTCYRMGGDEFVILIPENMYDQLERILIEIKEIFAKPWFLKGADYYCTMSMGIVSFPSEGDTVQELIKKADIAMYEAKRGGKNKIARFAEEADSIAYRRLGMEKNMRRATSTEKGFNEFEVYYQPIIDITRPGNPCVGAEALLRWNNSELGFISPADFIPLAEYLGLINPIGGHVLRKACEACQYWNQNGHPDYKVNVNLSVVQLLQNDIVDSISQIILETGINPKNLTFEVTESLAINDMTRMKEVLASIRALGARIALDDFGTGYSSLNHIREIPLDVIKVDQSFVRDLAVNQYSQSFIKMVAELAEAIDVKVCVEGIETESQYDVIKDMKVSLIQGYYFDKPMPASKFDDKYVIK